MAENTGGPIQLHLADGKRPDAALRTSETRYRRLFEAARDGILILDADTGKIVDVNPFLVELTGYSHEEFLDRHLWEIGPFKDIAASKESFGELRTEKYIRYEDLPLKTREGRKIDVEFVSNVYLEDGRKVIQCNIRDITERKRTEEELALNFETEAALNSLLSLSLEGRGLEEFLARALDLILSLKWLAIESKGAIFLTDEAGKTLQLRAQKNFPKELLAACSTVPFGRCLCGRAAAGRAVQFADRLDERHEVRYPGIQPHGHYCVPILSGDRVLGVINLYVKEGHTWRSWEEGFLKAVANTLSGAVARKRTEEALRESEGKYRLLVENARDVVLQVTPDGIVTYCSPVVTAFGGYDAEEEIGQHVGKYLADPSQMERILPIVADSIEKRESRSFEFLFRSKEGVVFWVEVTGKPFIENSQVTAVHCIVRDITERKRAEAEKEQLEEQLRTSQKMESIGSLAGGIAHDFNNLLSVILSYTDFAMEEAVAGGPLGNDLMEVKKAADRAVALTRQLLAFSRKQVLQPVPLDLNQVAAGVEQMLRRIIGEDIDLVQRLAPDLGLTLADPGQLEQVLMNLVVNARDAMPGGGELTIETANVEIDEEYAARHLAVTPGRYVLLAVTDTGCGMDAPTRARIFEPFFTTKEKGRGTGLGLSTVYGIVRQSGGDIWVYSEPGQGTAFKIYLPRDSSLSAPAPTPSAPPKRACGTETILVVEDEEALRKVALRTLDGAGYTVLSAADGDEALHKSARHAGEIHLLVTDVVMPRMSGRVLAELLSKTRPSLKVLYMSGYSDEAIVHHGVIEAGTHFLGKPFTAAELARKVREVLDEAPHPAPADPARGAADAGG